jgi:hypothetical protein
VFDEYHLRTNYPNFDFLCDKNEPLKENNSEKSSIVHTEKARSLSISPPPKNFYVSEDTEKSCNFIKPFPSSGDIFALSRSKLISLSKKSTLGEFRDEMYKVLALFCFVFYEFIFS